MFRPGQIANPKGRPKGSPNKLQPPSAVRALRIRLGLTQRQFCDRFGIGLGLLRDWEQGRRLAPGHARTLLLVIEREPEAVIRALEPGDA